MILRIWLSVVFLSILAAPGAGQVWYVSPEGSVEQNGSPEHPFATIQQALDAIEDGDKIILLAGVYTGAGNYDLRVSGVSLTLRSTDPLSWDVTAETVIDAEGAGGVFEFTDGQGLITIEGVTFRNALKLSTSDSSPEPPFYAEPHGAAIFCRNVEIEIRRCVFLNCGADLGGAVYFDGSEAAVSHCIFAGNEGWDGGALMSDLGSNVQMEHCTVAGNAGLFYGGGVSCEFGSTVSIVSSIFWGNDLSQPTAQGRQIYTSEGSMVNVDHSVIDGGTEGMYSNGASFILIGDGVSSDDPLFAFFDSDESPLTWDLRLKSHFGRWETSAQDWVSDAQTSLCIAAGPLAADYSREPWPNGRRANIGAYGNTEQASLFGNIADLNIDGRVDLSDYALLAGVWMGEPHNYEDFDDSGLVDFNDLMVIVENWFWEMPTF